MFDMFGSGFKTTRVPPGSEYNLPEDSAFKVGKESKDTKQIAMDPQNWKLQSIETARLNHGVYTPNTAQSSSIVTADYYRRGKLRASNSDSATTKRIGDAYDYMPRFLQDPKEEEIASLRLIGRKSINSKTEDIDLIPPYSKFFLENYSEGHAERSQIVETFGEAYVFFFGERPAIYTFNGTLLNTKDINWKEDFMFYYKNFLRGTKAVEYKAKVLLTYGLNQIEGYVMGINTGANAQSEKGVQMSFQMLVTKRRTMQLSVDFGIIEDNGKFNEDTSMINLMTKGISDSNISVAYNHADQVNKLKSPPSKIGNINSSNLNAIQDILPNQKLTARDGSIGINT